MQQMLLDSRYELEQKIGEGGMATVYLGRDRRLNRPVAIKALHSHYARDPDFLNRFRHEAQAAAILNHPNIVNVYDVGQDGDIHYIVMEYVQGHDLKKLINREAPLPIAQAVTITEAVARGLEAAHRFGLVHRDIKPQNIMVEPDGHVRITDFGIAKSQLSTALTETGITFGTADYISPEQAQGKPATPRSDIYSLGITLYEMLTGRLPFTGESTVSVAMQHVSAQPPLLRQFNPQIPARLEALVLQSLSKDPMQRPASAQEFARLLQDYRNLSDQETVFTPNVVRRSDEPARVRPSIPAPGNGSTSGRIPVPPPRPAVSRAPRKQGHSCGTFVLGMFLLAGVLGLVLLFSTGTFDNLFAGTGVPARSTPVPPTPSTRPTETATPTPSPSPTPVLATVPDITNQAEDAARSILEERRLIPVANAPQYSDIVPINRVISQEVPAGTQIEEGQPVTYTLSLGSSLVDVPDSVGVRLDFARQQAEQRGINVDVVEEPSQTVSEGFIIRQSPNPGARVSPGDTMVLVVSIGDKVRMPELTRRSEDEAKAILANTDGLSWEYTDYQTGADLADFRPGEVVSMAFSDGRPISGGDWVPRGSRIVLGVRGNE